LFVRFHIMWPNKRMERTAITPVRPPSRAASHQPSAHARR
jgi:hypothetical protein